MKANVAERRGPFVPPTRQRTSRTFSRGMKVTLEAEDIARVETPYRPKGILGF